MSKDAQIVKVRAASYLGLTALVTTLSVTPYLSFEPINWIKMLVLAIGSFATLGMCFAFVGVVFSDRLRILASVIALSLQTLFLFSLVGNGVTASSFWGISGRATGFLTYSCLLIMFFLSMLIAKENGASRVLTYFISSCTLTLLYMTVQFASLDPIAWSRKETFSTLGNINFTSALMGMYLSALISQFRNTPFFSMKKKSVVSLVIVFVLVIAILLKSGSVQGLIGFALALTIYLYVNAYRRIGLSRFYFLSSIPIWISFIWLILSTTRSGPLYVETMAYRRDYWTAGFRMVKENLLLGQGFDSFGLWYRKYRGLEASQQNSERVSDSAHSILIDLTVSAGTIVGLLLFCLVVLSTRQAMHILLKSPNDKVFVIISLAWLAYLPQFLIGINQIGVGVWAWVFMGLIIGRNHSEGVDSRPTFEKRLPGGRLGKSGANKAQEINKGRARGAVIPAGSLLLSISFAFAGGSLALPPFARDVQFNSAYTKKDLNLMLKTSTSLGGSQFQMEKTLEFSKFTNDAKIIEAIATEVVDRYPNSYFGWAILADLKGVPDSLKREALERIKYLNPKDVRLR